MASKEPFSRPDDSKEGAAGERLKQLEPVVDIFLRFSRDFYDAYESIWEQLEGKHRELDKASLFEAMTFFVFLVDFHLFCSKQSQKTDDYLYHNCEGLILTAFDFYGTRDTLQKVIRARIAKYGEHVRSSDRRDPIDFFFTWCNPVINNMEYFRGGNAMSSRGFSCSNW